jgi:hypothetical protein
VTPSTSRLSAWLDPHPKLDGVALIDHLFNRLDGLYQNRWRAAFANQQAIDNWRIAWAEGFVEEGITLTEVKRGLDECRRRFDWPPSFAEFMKACRPALDYERAFHEAVEQMRRRETGEDVWSTPAVFWAAIKLGNDLLAHPYASLKSRWQAALDEAVEGVRTGKLPASAPKRRDALPPPGKSSVPPEIAKQRLAEIMAFLQAKKLARQQRTECSAS